MSWICGVEEAGRGPVFGPMVMAVCWVKSEDEQLLRKIGCKDSKMLTPLKREEVFARIKELRNEGRVGFEMIILSPKEIDLSVESEEDNLNHLELRTSAKLINRALKRVDLEKALIDCPTKNTIKFANGIKRLLKKKMTVIAEHKADVNYPVVSASSIIAKVTRDSEIKKIKELIEKETGSGYPSDPRTKRFLQENYDEDGYSKYFRKSWITYKRAVEMGKQRSLLHFDTKVSREEGREGSISSKRYFGKEPAKEDENDEKKDEKKKKDKQIKEAVKELLFLKEHGFEFVDTKGAYEVARLQGPGAVIIKYTTGKVLVQGKKKEEVKRLLTKKRER